MCRLLFILLVLVGCSRLRESRYHDVWLEEECRWIMVDGGCEEVRPWLGEK